MKCEKHGTDMVWRGDLRSGAMHCSSCAIEANFGQTITPTFDMGTAGAADCAGPLIPAPDQGAADIYKQLADALSRARKPRPSASRGIAPPPPAPVYYPLELEKNRTAAADRMLARHGRHVPDVCPYCLGASRAATNDGDRCQREYARDVEAIRRANAGSSGP